MVTKVRKGIPMSEEELAEWQKAFSDIEESIALVYKNGVDL
jgi:hypothetical protein